MPEYNFPQDFLWGAATAAHQVEGNNIHSDWWAWEQKGKVKDKSGIACDQYNRYSSDFDLAVEMNHNAHRLSLEWSRIEPAEGQFDDEAIAHYREVLEALHKRKLEPIVTLHHFTNPQWFIESGGWFKSDSVDLFARYVRRVMDSLGDLARFWITINEPMVYVNMHYVEGVGPPGKSSMSQVLKVIEHLIRAHAAGFHIIHEKGKSSGKAYQVSIAKHLPVFVPCHPKMPTDRFVTHLTDRIFNQAMLEALTEGRWHVPTIATWNIPEAKNTLDYLGINFYGRQFINWNPLSGAWLGSSCDLGHHPKEVTERTSMGWDVSPESFTQTLVRASKFKLPIIITENGTSMVDDAKRWDYISRHIAAVHKAREQGAEIIGYMYWSLLDNFEWAEGYGPRFGIIGVDYETQSRKIKDSGRKYGEVCLNSRLVLES